MRLFVPVEDASIDQATERLVPYRCGLACAHALRETLVLRDGVWIARTALSERSASRRPEPHRSGVPHPR